MNPEPQTSADELAARLRQAAGRVRLAQAQERPWIRRRIEANSLPVDAVCLGFDPFARNVHEARRAVYGEEDGVGLPLGGSSSTPGYVPFLGAPFNWYNDPASVAVGADSTYPYSSPSAAYPNVDAGKMGRPVRIVEITDGTSNTLMASETIQGRGSDLRGFTWWGGAAGFTGYIPPNSTLPDVITGGICTSTTNPRMPCTTTSTNAMPRLMGARSLHSNGVNVATCDGSVRFVPDGIDVNVWRALSSSQGNETASLN